MSETVHTQIAALPLSLDMVAGLELPPIQLAAEKINTVGRSSTCEVQLPDKAVSRNHAQIRCRAGQWQIVDLGSKHGTFLNGVQLEPNEYTPLRHNDLLSIDPWTFRARLGAGRPAAQTTTDDMTMVTQRVTTLQVADLATLAQQRLALLIDAAASTQQALTEEELATVVLNAALSGTGFSRAAIVRSESGGERVSVVAAMPVPATSFSFSRSLIRAAGSGEIVTMAQEGGGAPDGLALSIVSLNIESAVCAPIFLGPAIDAYLYLDARGGERAAHSQSAAFCKALSRMYGTALGNLKRLEVERMRGQLRAELEAAGTAQSFIMPSPAGRLGPFAYAFKSRPGRFASGDLFDIVEMPGGKVGMFLGDVAGKGAAAAIVMAMAQTHLRDVLSAGLGAQQAVGSLNRYIAPRNREGQFITLWLGVIDPAAHTLEVIDAGHGYWGIRPPDGGAAYQPPYESHLVVGIEPEYDYTSSMVEFKPGCRVMACSDGVIEQNNPSGEQFGRELALGCFSETTTPEHDVEEMVKRVLDYAATDALSDDVTVASTHWVR
ncbi:MAG: SpoIIE family protein phosphatase [Phycisphaerales bacterium]